ncbi:MAG TPA: ABC transporter permease [Candidatus Acidoferrales bacterium]|nr:ABC transporter permease [Candidatus Acidoferrales bacterium]
MTKRERMMQDLDQDIREHIATETQDNIARGMSPEDAHYAAVRKFGNVTRVTEETREVWTFVWLEQLFQDVRYGLRMLRRSPGFTVVAVLTLALGIGANTAIFSLVDGILLRPLPYTDADQIVHLSWQLKGGTIPNFTVAEFEFWRDHGSAFAAIAGTRGVANRELEFGATTRRVNALSVTDGFFQVLGVNPQFGRGFVRDETLPNGANGALLTDRLWRSTFGADPAIVGSQIVLDNRTYTVVGVLPSGYEFTEPADLLVSLHLGSSPSDLGFNTDVLARLKPGLSIEQAEAEMPLLVQDFSAQASGMEQREGSIHLDSYQSWLGRDYRMSLLMLLSAVGLLLLIACANVASLLLARANSRQKEISVRLALGASRGRLLRQFLTENLVLGIAGGVIGLAGAIVVLRVFLSAIPWELPAIDHISLDSRVLLFTFCAGTGASIAFGFASFLQTQRLDLNKALKDGRATTGGGYARGRFLNALVIGEVAVSLMLALGAGLLIQSLYNLYNETLGFNPEHLVLMETALAPGHTTSATNAWNLDRQALSQIRAIPGVQSAAIVSTAPLHGRGNLPAQRDGHPDDSIGGTEYRAISLDYFSTMGIAVLRGRDFQESDFSSSAPIALINETLARDWWQGGSPIGDHIVVGKFRGQAIPEILESPREIIGVVADVKGMEVGQPAPPMVYVPASQAINMNGSMDWVVRTRASIGIATELEAAIKDDASGQQVADIQPMTQLISASVAQPNFEATLMGMFGALALILTLVGVYGVLSFQVGQRAHEIGIRMALGASRTNVSLLVIGKAAKLAAGGVVIGVGGAFGLTRLIANLLYEVQPTDPVIFAAVASLVFVVAMIAAYIPTRRAISVDPLVALRYE